MNCAPPLLLKVLLGVWKSDSVLLAADLGGPAWALQPRSVLRFCPVALLAWRGPVASATRPWQVGGRSRARQGCGVRAVRGVF